MQRVGWKELTLKFISHSTEKIRFYFLKKISSLIKAKSLELGVSVPGRRGSETAENVSV